MVREVDVGGGEGGEKMSGCVYVYFLRGTTSLF